MGPLQLLLNTQKLEHEPWNAITGRTHSFSSISLSSGNNPKEQQDGLHFIFVSQVLCKDIQLENLIHMQKNSYKEV